MATDTFHAGHVSHLLGVQVSLSNQVVFHVAKHEAILSLTIDEVTHTLHMIELSLSEVTLNISLLAVSNLLKELIGCGIKY